MKIKYWKGGIRGRFHLINNTRKECIISRVKLWMGIAPASIFIIIFFLIPVGLILRSSLGESLTFQYFHRVLNTPVYREVFSRTILLCALATFFTALMGFPTAWVFVYGSRNWQRIAGVLILLPLVTNPLIMIYGWMNLLARNGWISKILTLATGAETQLSLLYSPMAVIVGIVYISLPFMVFPIASAMFGIKRSLLNAAASLGAGPFNILINIILPLSILGIIAGCLMVFIVSLGYFIIPALLGGGQVMFISTLIEQQINELLNWPLASAISVSVIGIIILTLFVSKSIWNWKILAETATH